MQIKFNNTFKAFKKGDTIDIIPNKTNFWVGENGCGKTLAISALNNHISDLFKNNHKKLESSNWMTIPNKEHLENYSFSGFENISNVSFYTAKVRQSHWVDMNIVYDSIHSIHSLKISEGMFNQAILVDCWKNYKDDPHHLFLFDEIDSTLDCRTKHLFFDNMLPKLKGTVVVCTHDCLFLSGKEVLDFGTNKRMTFVDYFLSQKLI